MNVDIETLLTYPMESDDWMQTILIGGVLSVFSFLLLPWFVVTGYVLEVMRSGMDAAESPPVFDDWGTLLKEGFVAAIIGLIYQLVPLVVFVFTVGASVAAFLTGTEAGAGLGLASLLGGLFLTTILSIVFGYIAVAGIANYARKGSFGAGFDVGVLTDVCTSRSYLVAWGYALLVFIVFGVVSGVVAVVPIVGAIAGIFISFYALVAAAWIWGHGFAEATETQTTSTPDAAGAAQ